MIRRCSWCQRVYGEKPPLEDTAVTHGICPECYDKQLALPANPTRAELSKAGVIEWDELPEDDFYDKGASNDRGIHGL